MKSIAVIAVLFLALGIASGAADGVGAMPMFFHQANATDNVAEGNGFGQITPADNITRTPVDRDHDPWIISCFINVQGDGVVVGNDGAIHCERNCTITIPCNCTG